jgi:hypothetical protein
MVESCGNSPFICSYPPGNWCRHLEDRVGARLAICRLHIHQPQDSGTVERKGRQRSETEGPEGLQRIPAAEVAASARPLSSVVTGVGGGGGPRRDDAAAETGRRVESDIRMRGRKRLGRETDSLGTGWDWYGGRNFLFSLDLIIGNPKVRYTPSSLVKKVVYPKHNFDFFL